MRLRAKQLIAASDVFSLFMGPPGWPTGPVSIEHPQHKPDTRQLDTL